MLEMCFKTHGNVSCCTGEKVGNKDKTLLDLAVAFFGVKAGGNVDPKGDPHGELVGQNVLTTVGSQEKSKLVSELGLANLNEFEEKIARTKEILYAERSKRPRPHLDNKIITSWNGLMIRYIREKLLKMATNLSENTRTAIAKLQYKRTYVTKGQVRRQKLKFQGSR